MQRPARDRRRSPPAGWQREYGDEEDRRDGYQVSADESKVSRLLDHFLIGIVLAAHLS
jgi:hypothetical protein